MQDSSLRNHHRWFADQVKRVQHRQHKKVTPEIRQALASALDYANARADKPFEREPTENDKQERLAMLVASAHSEAVSRISKAQRDALTNVEKPDANLHWYQWPIEVLLRHFHRHSLVDVQSLADLDGHWIEALEKRLTVAKFAFPASLSAALDSRALPDRAQIAIAGDWGTGLPESDLIAAQIKNRDPDITIHLGDVYYAGFPPECQRFVDRWPEGKESESAFALNSNHEMYSGGVGYFGTTLRSTKFAAQRRLSCFTLANKYHVIVGLDSAYFSAGVLYGRGRLADDKNRRQLEFLTEVASLAGDRTLTVLTHHDALGLDGKPRPLFGEVRAIVKRPFLWIWGHVHAGLAYAEKDGVRARCVGHGGVPYVPFSREECATLEWAETQLAGDVREPERALNGFYVLDLDGPKLVETFYDERGSRRWSATVATGASPS